MLLIRDPRDVVLSAIDYIDQSGLEVWPGLSEFIELEEWTKLTKLQKASVILDKELPHARKLSIVSVFETAINVFLEGDWLLVKFEELSPENCDYLTPRKTISDIARFLGKKIDLTEIELIIEKSFKNKESFTFNKGSINRYVSECDDEFRCFLNMKLNKYILFFGYNL